MGVPRDNGKGDNKGGVSRNYDDKKVQISFARYFRDFIKFRWQSGIHRNEKLRKQIELAPLSRNAVAS